jgi:hypothetical protein
MSKQLESPPPDPIVFVHGPPGAETAYVEGEPQPRLPLPDGGEATLWAASESQLTGHREIGWWLAYRTESWTILASLHHESGAEVLAGSLSASESETGFPSIRVSDPLALPEGFGESEGPVLALGDSNPVPDVVSGLLDGTVFLTRRMHRRARVRSRASRLLRLELPRGRERLRERLRRSCVHPRRSWRSPGWSLSVESDCIR